jgi:ubiquinone/menaquinone biosynthesis C-methylase UbiE
MINKLQQATIEANISVHTAAANKYNDSPHFNPENQAKVRKIIERLITQLPQQFTALSLIDFGCGSGFIINIVKDIFKEIQGVDVTQAMLDKIDLSSGNIQLTNGMAEDTPFADNRFHMATAYSFMDHLVDYKALLKEAYRVLKPGGIFYIDLNPNRYFWDALAEAEKDKKFTKSELLNKEIYATIHNDDRVSKMYNLDIDKLKQAEPIKNENCGFEPHEVINAAQTIGFTTTHFDLHWFVSQASVLHNKSFAIADEIDEHLTKLLPLSKHLFKYIRFIFQK